jgi:CTP-dependent riboflavin kinase
MKILKGKIATGRNSSSRNLRQRNVDIEIAAQMGFSGLCPGTLNIELYQPYPIGQDYDGYVEACKYNDREWIKLVRCRLRGTKCIVVRPQDHERVGTFKNRIELMSLHNLREKFNLADGDEVEVEVEGDQNWWNSPDA